MAWRFDLAAIDDHSDHLKAYWRMEETGAADRTDDVGSNDLSAANTPGTRVGISNNACDFIAASVENLSIADNADLSPSTGLAMSLWLITDLVLHHGIIAKSHVGAADFYLSSYNGGTQFTWNIVQSDTTGKQIGNIGFATGTLRHVVVMACDGFLRVYINNVEQGTPVAYDNTIQDTANLFNVGIEPWSGNDLDGGIDELGFWKDISFADQTAREAFVAGLYNDGTGRFYHEIAAPTVDTFTATPDTMDEGSSSTLAWTTSNAGTSVSIDNGIGAVAEDGSTVVSPTVPTTYTITATGPGGEDTDTVEVTVYPAVGIAYVEGVEITADIDNQEVQSVLMDDTQAAAIAAVKAAMVAASYTIRRHTCMHANDVVISCVSVVLEVV